MIGQHPHAHLIRRHKKYAEIAAELGISVNTVKYHMKNALAYLHKRLEDYVKWITILAIMNF